MLKLIVVCLDISSTSVQQAVGARIVVRPRMIPLQISKRKVNLKLIGLFLTPIISDNMDEKRELFVEVKTNSASTDETVERIVATVKICRWRDGNLIDGFDNSKIDFCQIKFSQFDKNIYIALLTSFRYFKICKNTQKFLNHFL